VGIELNGSTHFFNNRLNRDRLTENLLRNIGVEYCEISLSTKFDESKIKDQIEKKIDLVNKGLVIAKGYSQK
jgi:LPS O-antigen subunit length determinant protein (WzzB/FepE family)